MKSKLREHSCKIGVDYVNKIIIVSPEEGSSRIVLTTPALYAWHQYNLTTEEGISHWKLLEIGGFIKKEMVLKLLKDYVLGFVNCKEIFVYGIILSGKMNGSIFSFEKDSAKIIQGSPAPASLQLVAVSACLPQAGKKTKKLENHCKQFRWLCKYINS